MQKTHYPQVRVPGATPVLDDLGFKTVDKKGRLLWDMPSPSGQVEHVKYRRHKRTGERIAAPVMVPTYHAYPASLVREIRYKQKRQARGRWIN